MNYVSKALLLEYKTTFVVIKHHNTPYKFKYIFKAWHTMAAKMKKRIVTL